MFPLHSSQMYLMGDEISKAELLRAIKYFKCNKAPRSDSYTSVHLCYVH